MTDDELVALAAQARRHAYAPYSHFAVGAALLAQSGRVYTGANVENASYGLAVCAERVAVWQAVAAGERAFTAIAVVTENGVSPCGACRQVLAEFASDPRTLRLIVADTQGRRRTYTLAELLPEAFTPEQLPQRGGT
ncbi:MAG: cytidine deaminase [Chloroflexi bacterium]|nr:cytidine deaminase [Chloroflexota bacterium]